MRNSMNEFILKHNGGRVLLGCIILVGVMLTACRDAPQVTPSPMPGLSGEETAPTGERFATPEPDTTTADTMPPPLDAWATVKNRGQLVVGTSADYPPFAFYTDEFELAGYDVALARLLGERLGVAVEFKDMAFDSLGGALQVGQIDAALAAISITDARREQVDFSTLYFISEGAALGRADSGITIDTLADLAPYRVAVQDGTVYHAWLEEEAIGAGL